jgi:drug/metabolite transporter (DMT)-like permease
MEFTGKPLKGYGLIFLANLCLSVVFLIAKDVQPRMGLYPFLFYWFMFASTYYLIIIFKTKGMKTFGIPRRLLPLVVLMGVFEVAATFLFFYTIRLMNPALASFYGNISIVMTVALGVIFLSERFTVLEGIGGAILVIGVVLMTYKSGKVVFIGFLLIIFFSLLFSINTVLIKISLKDVYPVTFSAYRTFLLFLSVAIIYFFQSGHALPAFPTLFEIAVGAFLGPFLGVLLLFTGLQYLEASKASLVRATNPLMVLAGSYFWLHQVPTLKQCVGGLITLAGIELLLWGKFKLERKKTTG